MYMTESGVVKTALIETREDQDQDRTRTFSH